MNPIGHYGKTWLATHPRIWFKRSGVSCGSSTLATGYTAMRGDKALDFIYRLGPGKNRLAGWYRANGKGRRYPTRLAAGEAASRR